MIVSIRRKVVTALRDILDHYIATIIFCYTEGIGSINLRRYIYTVCICTVRELETLPEQLQETIPAQVGNQNDLVPYALREGGTLYIYCQTNMFIWNTHLSRNHTFACRIGSQEYFSYYSLNLISSRKYTHACTLYFCTAKDFTLT